MLFFFRSHLKNDCLPMEVPSFHFETNWVAIFEDIIKSWNSSYKNEWCMAHIHWGGVHSSSMAVWSCWILAHSQTCPVGDMSGEYAGHARTGMFSAFRNCVQIFTTWSHALSCWREVRVANEWHDNGPQNVVTVSLCIQIAINKMHLCSLSVP